MNILNNLSPDLQNKAISLSSIGVKDSYAWHQPDILAVLNELSTKNLAILGGDILILQVDGTIEYTFDNWYFNRLPESTWRDYVTESNAYAQDYISAYEDKKNRNVICNLIIANEAEFDSLKSK